MTAIDNGPIPQGLYRAAVRDGLTIQTSGMTPRQGNALAFAGRVGKDDDPAVHREAVRLATSNALGALRSQMREGECPAPIRWSSFNVSAVGLFQSQMSVASGPPQPLQKGPPIRWAFLSGAGDWFRADEQEDLAASIMDRRSTVSVNGGSHKD